MERPSNKIESGVTRHDLRRDRLEKVANDEVYVELSRQIREASSYMFDMTGDIPTGTHIDIRRDDAGNITDVKYGDESPESAGVYYYNHRFAPVIDHLYRPDGTPICEVITRTEYQMKRIGNQHYQIYGECEYGKIPDDIFSSISESCPNVKASSRWWGDDNSLFIKIDTDHGQQIMVDGCVVHPDDIFEIRNALSEIRSSKENLAELTSDERVAISFFDSYPNLPE